MTLTDATALRTDSGLPAAADLRLLLATDLDGTFLAGSDRERQRLYRVLAERHDVGLVWVTGRGLEAVLPLLSDPAIPAPDFIICDVGATVVYGEDVLPLEPLQAEIAERWPGDHVVQEAIGERPGLHRQDVPQERRCSYYCAPEAVDDDLRRTVATLGCELLYSANRYLDILPPGVTKGATLEHLIDHLGMPAERVLVAGDTLNDRSMFGRGYAGVCVGGAEPGLLEATRALDQVYHAGREGCGGIIEAIEHYGLLEREHLRDPRSATHPGKAQLVMLYHRPPYDEYVEDGEVKRRPPRSPNGIIPTLLSFFADGREGSWVAWTTHEADGRDSLRQQVDPERYPRLTASRVPLSKKDVDIFYKSFSKEAFWPLLHTFWERARFREDHWQVFCKVNRAFAETAAAEAADGATVWIHDYNLWMVPAYLRELRPDVRIAFFHHTHFPSADVFNVVPWRRAIVGSLLQCDYIGFHIPRQVENFVDVARGVAPVETLRSEGAAPRFVTYGCAVGVDKITTEIDVGGRRVRLGAHPVGLDTRRIRRIMQTDQTRERIERLRQELGDQQMLLSVERLDYTKGTLQKLQAFERVLARAPHLHGKISLYCICVPAAKEMTIYRKLQTQIEQIVGRINGRFARLGWTPLHFFFRPLPFDELLAYYAVARLMWITPLRDGLNLVAKEYVAAQGGLDGDGVLLLSEFAGAAAELKGALLTNPHDIDDLADGCLQALDLNPAEAQRRMRDLYGIVSHYDIAHWGDAFLGAVENETADANETDAATPVRATLAETAVLS